MENVILFTKFDLIDICGIDEATYLTKILWNHCPSKQAQREVNGRLRFMSIFAISDALESCKCSSNYANKEVHKRLLEVLIKLKYNMDKKVESLHNKI